MTNFNKKILKEFDERFPVEHYYTCLSLLGDDRGYECDCSAKEYRKEIKSFILSALTQQLEEIRDEIDEKRVGCPEHPYSFKQCESFGYNIALKEVKDLINSKLKELKS